MRRQVLTMTVALVLTASADGGGHAASTRVRMHGPLRAHGIQLVDGRGKAVHLAGHQIFCDLQDQIFGVERTLGRQAILNWDWYMKFMAERHLNYIRNWSHMTFGAGKDAADPARYTQPLPYARTGPGLAVDGRPKFDLNRFDEAFFRRMRRRVADAERRGIYVSIMFFDLYGFLRNDLSHGLWDGNAFNAANNIQGISAEKNGEGCGFLDGPDETIKKHQKAYIRKVIETFAPRPDGDCHRPPVRPHRRLPSEWLPTHCIASSRRAGATARGLDDSVYQSSHRRMYHSHSL